MSGARRSSPPDVGVGVDHLSLEVRPLDDVVVGDAERPDAGRREVLDDRRAEAASSDDEDTGVQQPFLSLGPDTVHDDVPGVAVELLGVEREIGHGPGLGGRRDKRPAGRGEHVLDAYLNSRGPLRRGRTMVTGQMPNFGTSVGRLDGFATAVWTVLSESLFM